MSIAAQVNIWAFSLSCTNKEEALTSSCRGRGGERSETRTSHALLSVAVGLISQAVAEYALVCLVVSLHSPD